MPREVKWAISLAVGAGLLFLGWKVYFLLVTLHERTVTRLQTELCPTVRCYIHGV